MATDMDIEMDLDVTLGEEDMTAPEAETMIQDPDDSSSNDILVPNKIHIRGLDNLTEKDVKSFATEHFSQANIERVEWIDDTSANLVYSSAEVAKEALMAFSATEIADVMQLGFLQTIPAKPLSSHSQTSLQIRFAVQGDRKQAGARDRSRFYLFNPEYDRAERLKRGNRRVHKYRDRDDGGYRSQRYDEYEQRRRENGDENSGFDASLYDDDEAALAQRSSRRRRRRDSSVSSGSDSRGRRTRQRAMATKELFPDKAPRDDKSKGRLRNRSASPVRDVEMPSKFDDHIRDSAAAANRRKAQAIKSQLMDSISGPKELFPHVGISHHRSDAFDAADETADIFANKMNVPFLDGALDQRSRVPSLASRITSTKLSDRITPKPEDTDTFNIKGSTTASAVRDFAIKGGAGGASMKELFPSHNTNAGKELFSERLQGRGGRRQKAEDLFS
ncbi:hypothetical protein F5884DRAFT_192513 [Xylogone sp. PMI_703]|nr:hypothetical protein F5884DRAFT_192513 [Xylogone sp. PMI_703]